MKLAKKLRKFWPEVILFTFFFLFSWWLMWHTFHYQKGVIYVASKVWSDFAANLPLIRSFSWGNNFPPEYPLFPGEPIRYHFLFYLLVGFLEKIGLPLSWALNLPSALGFWALLLGIYFLAKTLFDRKSVAFLSVAFFLFNGSFSFLEYFRQHSLSLTALADIVANKHFPSFGPYDGKVVSAFWNLNIFTNQRHLAGAYALVLFAIYLVVRAAKLKKPLPLWQVIILGITIGLLPLYHKAVFLMLGVMVFWFFLCLPKLRLSIFFTLLIAGVMALPQIAYQLGGARSFFAFNPGYLVSRPPTVLNFFHYWFFNLGLAILLIPLGFLFSKRVAKKIFLAFFLLFLIGNLFQFSPEMAANHKFFNLFLIGGNMFSAWLIYLIWRKNILGKLVIPILIFLLIFSGIIDFFPIKNDSIFTINDSPKNPDVFWIRKNTSADSIFLNSYYIYHPASLAGRKVFLGWPYFAWSAGYDTTRRGMLMKEVYEENRIEVVCHLLKENDINYLDTIEPIPHKEFEINYPFFEKNFIIAYRSPDHNFIVYDVIKSCRGYR